MAVSGGHHVSIVNNTIFGRAQSFTNVGLYYHSYCGPSSTSVYIAKNIVNYTNSSNEVNNTYLGPGDPTPVGWSTNVYDAGMTEHILPDKILSWNIFSSK